MRAIYFLSRIIIIIIRIIFTKTIILPIGKWEVLITPTSQSLLDPVITNHHSLVQEAGVIPPICSDHHGTYANLNFKVPANTPYKKEVWSYEDGDYANRRLDKAVEFYCQRSWFG